MMAISKSPEERPCPESFRDRSNCPTYCVLRRNSDRTWLIPKAFGTHSPLADRDRSYDGEEASAFAVADSVSGRAIRIASLGPQPAEQVFNHFFQNLLKQLQNE